MDEIVMLLLAGGLLQMLFWMGLPVLVLVVIARAIRRSMSAGSRALLGQFQQAVENAQRAFENLPAGSEAERQAKQALILQVLSGIGTQYGRLGSNMQSSYSPTIASLHSMAAQNGIDWTPPNY